MSECENENNSWASCGFIDYVSNEWHTLSPLIQHLVHNLFPQNQEQQSTDGADHGQSLLTKRDRLVFDFGSVPPRRDDQYRWQSPLPYDIWRSYFEFVCESSNGIMPQSRDWEEWVEYDTHVDVSVSIHPVIITIRPPHYDQYSVTQELQSSEHKHYFFAPMANQFTQVSMKQRTTFTQLDKIPDVYSRVRAIRRREFTCTMSEFAIPVSYIFEQIFEGDSIAMLQNVEPTYHFKISVAMKHILGHNLNPNYMFLSLFEKIMDLQGRKNNIIPYFVSAYDATSIQLLAKRIALWVEMQQNLINV